MIRTARRITISPATWRTFRGVSTTSANSDRLLVVGSGVAGSAAALIAAETYKIPVTVLFAGHASTDCNSYWAQGGIIYKGSNEQDSPDLLASDIHRAGAGLCVDAAVQKVAREGPTRVRELLLNAQKFANVPFQRCDDNNELALCLEASHSAARILYKADHTGKCITEHITAAATQHPLIAFRNRTVVTDLVVADGLCVGVETVAGDRLYAAHGTVLASGGLAGIYEHTTNPPGFNALGSSVALAERAGVSTQDLEFVQFHPTALNLPNQPRFLLTEALRGEGAILRDASGRPFCRDYHEAAELAPRDVVARAVYAEMQKSDVYLDITHRDADWLHQRFPTICRYLAENSSLDLARDQLPITPAAHYTCGGIATDLNGATNLAGCYAAGEAARTGLHGGNRLASTSLLEGLVFGASVAEHVGRDKTRTREAARAIAALENESQCVQRLRKHSNSDDGKALSLLRRLRRVMWDNVGVARTGSGLSTAVGLLKEMRNQADDLYRKNVPAVETAAVRDATAAGYAVAKAALANKVSVGAHCIVSTEENESDDDEEAAVAAR